MHEFDQAESEFPELVAAVLTEQDKRISSIPLILDSEAIEQCVQGTWQGKANRLSRDNPVPWELIDDVTKTSWKATQEIITIPLNCSPQSNEDEYYVSPSPLGGEGQGEGGKPNGNTDTHQPQASQIIHQRRSAVAFDGQTSMYADRFFLMLSRVMPQAELPVSQRTMPWDAISWQPTIHLALFVHRVEGIPPGLYMLARDPAPKKLERLKTSMQEQFVWNIPEGCPEDLPLYLLEEGNAQKIATQVSCWQEIAGSSTFSLGMIAEFDSSIQEHGQWFYKRLFWETGLIGQVLYLEAEAAGVRATGIGCFFDDPVHRVFGFFPHTQFQSLYHFTVGSPVEDSRLTTLPPYGDHIS